MPALEFRGFGWRYAGRREWAVRGLDLTIGHGEHVLLLGPSGAGKSTVLLAAAGLLSADGSGTGEGHVWVDGVASAAARDRVGMVFQDPDTQIVMGRIGDDVAFGLENLEVPPGEIWPRVDESLAAVGLGYPREHGTDRLSGGEKQRLALAGALSRRPQLLLLDEPTANLDPPAAARLRGTVSAAADSTMVLVEHRIEEWLPLVDRVVVLEAGGGVALDGSPHEVLVAHRDTLVDQGVWVPGFAPDDRRSAVPAGPALLRGEELAFRYPGAGTAAVADVSLSVHAHEAVAVLGVNGSGKSTVALMLAGLLRPAAGAALDDSGRRLIQLPAAELAGRVGSVFQQPEHQFLTDRVRDELALGPRRRRRTGTGSTERVDELLHRLRLADLADANPYTLSGGEKRRLSVATALASRPGALVLDEPTFGQDLRTWRELVDLLAGVRADGVGILAVTHDPAFATALADRTVHMAGGRIVTPDAVPAGKGRAA
ncbi:MAG: ATP-binding cassette domain-containing protein [Streptosporangiales bacterium]|nr:ATP-binding cassette domain-containing protein [Streptosporangiales bacterium]